MHHAGGILIATCEELQILLHVACPNKAPPKKPLSNHYQNYMINDLASVCPRVGTRLAYIVTAMNP